MLDLGPASMVNLATGAVDPRRGARVVVKCQIPIQFSRLYPHPAHLWRQWRYMDSFPPALRDLLAFGRPLLLGILNVTPDSFFDGNQYLDIPRAVARAHQIAAEGADLIDIGAESSRPGAQAVDPSDQLRRLLPVLEQLAGQLTIPISIDTTQPSVADRCLALGATIINDITALGDPAMANVCQSHRAAVILMHMPGIPLTMQQHCHYTDVAAEVKHYLQKRVDYARAAGLKDIVIDPGLGFGKTAQQNFELLARLGEFQSLGCPILVGPSRKSFLGQDSSQRLPGTIAAVVTAVFAGARIVRVHDVQACRQALDTTEAILKHGR